MFTPTVQRADIILPANTSLERNDLAGTKIADFVFAMHQAIPSLGDSRSDFEIFDKIAAKLGVGNDFNEGRDEMGWLRHLYDITRRDAAQRFDHDMPDFDTFWTQGYARVPKEANRVYLADFRDDPGSFPLNTESGKIVLGSEMLASLEYDDCRAHPAWIEPAEWLGKSDGTLFHLISNQPAGRLHSQLETGEASLAMKRNGREQVSINSEDAAALGIQSGDLVRLWNERGSCLATAELTSSIRRDVVVLPTGAWFTPHAEQGVELAGNPNVLTLDIGSSQFGQGCSAFTCLVRVEKFNGDASDALRAYQASLDALTK
jgi:biotin/methionine sulfoxide reductase